jgi:hypothetical protein
MAQTLTFTIKFNVDPPNVQQALGAVNKSLRNVGVSITNGAETSPKLNALDDMIHSQSLSCDFRECTTC